MKPSLESVISVFFREMPWYITMREKKIADNALQCTFIKKMKTGPWELCEEQIEFK